MGRIKRKSGRRKFHGFQNPAIRACDLDNDRGELAGRQKLAAEGPENDVLGVLPSLSEIQKLDAISIRQARPSLHDMEEISRHSALLNASPGVSFHRRRRMMTRFRRALSVRSLIAGMQPQEPAAERDHSALPLQPRESQMFDSSQAKAVGPRQQMIDEALIVIQKAATGRTVLSLAAESNQLAARHPDSGMTENDIRELVARLAVERGVSIGFD